MEAAGMGKDTRLESSSSLPSSSSWWWPWNKKSQSSAAAATFSPARVTVFFVVMLLCVFYSAHFITNTSLSSTTTSTFTFFASMSRQAARKDPSNPPPRAPPFTCPIDSGAPSCSSSTTYSSPPSASTNRSTPPPACPDYFRWIHEDLSHWSSGITREDVERARPEAAFRLVVSGGRAFVDRYHGVFQTRDVFTIWGIIQLLRRYPGRVPDLDLMFNCEDMPVVRAAAGGSPAPPPLFRYCKDDATVDILFPDWSFWGWPEVNIKPWEKLLEEMEEANAAKGWDEREPSAFWRGNPYVSPTRGELLKCNVSTEQDWNARIFTQNWDSETKGGFKNSNLASQCTHRYKIYVEGRSWSVSEKYILACDSPALFVSTRFTDFFSRGLRPGRHYLPVERGDMCRSIKSAVEWGNSHKDEAKEIGRAGSGFVKEELKMDFVYDYMFHLLSEYSKLLTYAPSMPENATEYCLETLACPADGTQREFLVDSMAWGPREAEPCAMPPSFSSGEKAELKKKKKMQRQRRRR